MGIGNADGTHELYLASVFADGAHGSIYRANQVEAATDRDGRAVPADQRQWRPFSEVTGFAMACDCAASSGYTSTTVILARWERVSDPAEEDLTAGRLYLAPGQNTMDACDRDDVETAMRRIWADHLAPGHVAAQLEAAWSQHRRALSAVEEAVRAARAAGLSWVEVGRATAMTRQSARERWGKEPTS